MVGPVTPSSDDRAAALAGEPEVAAAVERARAACARLRLVRVPRDGRAGLQTELLVRGARASAALEGADLPVEHLRGLVTGRLAWPAAADAVHAVARGAVLATAAAAEVAGVVSTAPAQALVRLHLAAAAGLLAPDQVGRPRAGGETSRDLDRFPTAAAAEPGRVMGRVVDLLRSPPEVPALLVLGLAHAEVAAGCPFVAGNGLVARALDRAVLAGRGMDPSALVVPELGHAAGGPAAYLAALTAYRAGDLPGVVRWLQHCAAAVEAGAAEGERVAGSWG